MAATGILTTRAPLAPGRAPGSVRLELGEDERELLLDALEERIGVLADCGTDDPAEVAELDLARAQRGLLERPGAVLGGDPRELERLLASLRGQAVTCLEWSCGMSWAPGPEGPAADAAYEDARLDEMNLCRALLDRLAAA